MTTENFKVAFAGSGPFAEPVFQTIIEKYPQATLFVKEGTLKDTGVGLIAEEKGVKVIQSSTKDDFHKKIVENTPDIVVVVSFGIIISKETLALPKYGFINVHYSLLPKYRGPSPVQDTILSGDKVSGITFQKMAAGIDTGDILFQEEVEVGETDTTETLGARMASLSAEKLPEVITSYIEKRVEPKKQNDEPATYTKIITKADGEIDWNEPAEIIERKVRAYTPWPSTYTRWNGKVLKILEASAPTNDFHQKVGTFYEVAPGKYGVQTGKGTLLVKRLQLEGKKPLETSDFLLGNSQIVGCILG